MSTHARRRQSPAVSQLGVGTTHNPTEWVNHSACVMSSSPSTSVHCLADARVAAFGQRYVAEISLEPFGDFLPHYSAYREPEFRRHLPGRQSEPTVVPGDLVVGGSGDEVDDKLASQHDAIGITRFVGEIRNRRATLAQRRQWDRTPCNPGRHTTRKECPRPGHNRPAMFRVTSGVHLLPDRAPHCPAILKKSPSQVTPGSGRTHEDHRPQDVADQGGLPAPTHHQDRDRRGHSRLGSLASRSVSWRSWAHYGITEN